MAALVARIIAVCLAAGAAQAQPAADKVPAVITKVLTQDDPAATIARVQASVPAPREADVRSIDAIMGAIYDVISGPAGPRDWNRFRSLMLPEGRLTESTVDAKGRPTLRQFSVDQFVIQAGAGFSKTPFFEKAIVNKVERFGNVAQVFSSYASRIAPGAAPFQRGINSMQLVFDGKRWWVLSILWDAERPGNVLPKAMGG